MQAAETRRPYGPNVFQRGEQRTAARVANIESFRQAAHQDARQNAIADLLSHGIFLINVPTHDTNTNLPSQKQVLLTVAATLAVLNIACGTNVTAPTPPSSDAKPPTGAVEPAPGAAATATAGAIDNPHKVNIPIVGDPATGVEETKNASGQTPKTEPVTPPTPEATRELPPVISKKTLARENISVEAANISFVTEQQKAAFAKGEVLLVAPGMFLGQGGEIKTEKATPSDKNRIFYFVKPEDGPFNLQTQASGKVVQAEPVTKTTSHVRVQTENGLLFEYFFPRSAQIDVKPGDILTAGDFFATGTSDKTEYNQRGFVAFSYATDPSTVAILTIHKGTVNQVDKGQAEAVDADPSFFIRTSRGFLLVASKEK